jgi:hypothetical protein
MEDPLYSPDLASVDFYLLPRKKSSLKGRRVYVTDVIKNATRNLKRLSRNDIRNVSNTFKVAGKSE